MNMIAAIARSDVEMERVRSASRIQAGAAAVPLALSGDEQAAVIASLADGRASIGVGSFARLVRAVFGLRLTAVFAGERLEALRRYALLYRIEGAALKLEEDARLRGAGFSDRQAEAARALVDAHAPHRRERMRGEGRLVGAALLAIAAAAILFIDRWLARQVDDRLGALLITILLVTWIVSIAAVTSHPHRRCA
ncbi:MAG TPA: hypothetical protein VH331_16590 [Allosphingosinicella sp.]|jgi:hypothetical protein|nr:hypothetical protein [Allosphingosinicella sp.]